MSANLASFRTLRLKRRLFSSFSGGFLFLGALLAITAPQAKAGYSFTLIADSTGPFLNFGSISSPALNAGGTAAFYAALDNRTYGIFTGNGVTTTPIFVSSQSSGGLGYPSINQAGTVAFFLSAQAGFGDRIVSGNGGPLVTIADTTGQFSSVSGGYTASINSAGSVAFKAGRVSGGGIFIGNGGTATPLLLNSSALNRFYSVFMNDAGTLAFHAFQGQNYTDNGVFTYNNGTLTPITDSTGPLNYFGDAPSVNESDTVAFVGGKGGMDGPGYGIYRGNGGPLTTIADLSGPFSYFSLYRGDPSINAAGTVAFAAGLDAGGGGIFIGDGVDTTEVIGVGDALFGSTITGLSISPTSLNDLGQVAFSYGLADGTTGIAIATPTPEPSPTLLLAFSLGVGLARRARWLHRARRV